MSINIPAVTPLPDPPSTSDPATFDARADEFLGALPTFASESNAAAQAVPEAARAAGYSGAATGAAGGAARAYPSQSSDFPGVTSPQGPWVLTPVGTGTITALTGALVDPVHPGVARITGSSSTNGGTITLGSALDAMRLQGGDVFEAVLRVPNAANCIATAGWSDATAFGATTDGAFFNVSASGGLPTLQPVIASNGAQVAGLAQSLPTGGAWVNLRIEIAANGGSATFSAFLDDGSAVFAPVTLTGALPVASGRETGCGVRATTNSGSAQACLDVDYLMVGRAAPLQRGAAITPVAAPDRIAFGLSTAGENLNRHAVTVQAVSTQVSADLCLLPKGLLGALQAALPDGGVDGGSKRGGRAVDLQMSRTAANQVASGANSTISGGRENRAAGDDSTVVGGRGNSATATGSTILGGRNGTDRGLPYSVVEPHNSETQGSTQHARMILRAFTSSTASAILTVSGVGSGGLGEAPSVPANRAIVHWRIRLMGIDSNGLAGAWEGRMVAKRATTGGLAAVLSQSLTSVGQDASFNAIAGLSLNSGFLNISVSNTSGTNTNWIAHVEALEFGA